jgi:hypothetical protein
MINSLAPWGSAITLICLKCGWDVWCHGNLPSLLTWQIGFSSLRTSHCKVLWPNVLEVDRYACCRMGQFDLTIINWTFNRKRWDGRVLMQAWTTYKFCILWYSSLQVTHIQAKLWNSCCYIRRTNAEERVKVCAHILLVIYIYACMDW